MCNTILKATHAVQYAQEVSDHRAAIFALVQHRFVHLDVTLLCLQLVALTKGIEDARQLAERGSYAPQDHLS